MLFSRISKNLRGSFNSCRGFLSIGDHNHRFLIPHNFHSRGDPTHQVSCFIIRFCFVLFHLICAFWDLISCCPISSLELCCFCFRPFSVNCNLAMRHAGSLLFEFVNITMCLPTVWGYTGSTCHWDWVLVTLPGLGSSNLELSCCKSKWRTCSMVI